MGSGRTMLSCSFSSSRWSSAAVRGRGCRIGPCSEGWRSRAGEMVVAWGGLGEEGRLLVLGIGGGPMMVEVLRESSGLAVWEVVVGFVIEVFLEDLEGRGVLTSGGAMFVRDSQCWEG